jgi:hypothetical protein
MYVQFLTLSCFWQHPDNVEVLLRFARAYKCKANLAADDNEGRKEAAYKGL